MKNICLSWVGGFDFTKFLEDKKDDGVFLALMKSDIAKTIDDFHILINTNSKHSNVRSKFLKYANRFCSKRQKIIVHEFSIKPSVLSDVHGSVMEVIREIESVTPATAIKWHFQLGGGAPQINAVWLMLVKVGYRAELIMTIHDKKSDSIKIEMRCPDKAISAEEFDDIIKKCDARLLDEWSNFPKYESIVHKSTVMKNLINNAFSIARHDVPILILGETGTGKELFAKAIHSSSGRTKLPMLTQNCAAIQESTANATLFGWSKGAWTGSVGEGRGLFQECHGGTLFLDEIADLSPEIQTRLLRALEYGEIQRVGDGRVCKVD
ncbi:MAG TPA: sigma 54-interacting transcriptional regulator, partial [bacterium]|nr:sigma 54-interacting transcriptional regulator [bacterium]